MKKFESTCHNPSAFSNEISANQKSQVLNHTFCALTLSLDTRCDFQKFNDMADIIEDLSRYVPIHESTASADVHGSCLHIDDSKLVNILLFGDQLTVACAQGAMQLQDDDNTSLHSLEGFVPAIAD